MNTALVILVFVVVIALSVARQKARNEGARKIMCPHCHTTGTVSMRPVKVKRGISGGKATGALLTFGASTLVTGLSRKEKHLKARCSNCNVDWLI